MTPLISIIIPIYRVEQYIDKCVSSVIGQTYKNIEIILVDDGSPDRCGEICDRYAEADSRIVVIHKSNGGLSDARNEGMKVAHGEYLTFIDSDDSIHGDYCEFLLKKMQQYNADIVVTPLRSVSESGEDVSREFTGNETVMSAGEAMRMMFARDSISWCAPAKLYRRELFDGISFPVGWLMEDKATTYKVYDRCKKIVFVDTPKYDYLVRIGSIMRSKITDKHIKAFDIQITLNEYIEKNYPDVIPTSHAYTARCALSLLCQMRANDIEHGEKTVQLIDCIIPYRKEMYKSELIDKRFKLLARGIAFLYAFRKYKFYNGFIFKRVAKIVDKKISSK